MPTVRPMRRADLEAYGELCRYCFWMPPEYVPAYAEWVGHSLSHTWGAFDGARLVAGMWYYPFQMRVGGDFLPMGGVAAVATAPESRDAGLARLLIGRAHRQMRAEKRPFAVLMPFQHEFYRRMGYGDVFFMNDCAIPPAQIAPRPTGPYRLEVVDPQREWETLERLHQEYGARYFGTVRRNALYWRVRTLSTWRGVKNTYIVRGAAERPVGFVITNLLKEDTAERPQLNVVHAAWTEPAALNPILQFLRRHRDQVPKIIWRLPVDVSLHEYMIDPRIEVALKPKMMLKLVDLRGAIERRTYPSDLEGDLVLDVGDDPISPWNEGRWEVRWRQGRARLRRLSGSARKRGMIRVDMPTLAVVYSGRRRAQDLAAAGMLSGPEGMLELLDRAFPAGVPHMEEWF